MALDTPELGLGVKPVRHIGAIHQAGGEARAHHRRHRPFWGVPAIVVGCRSGGVVGCMECVGSVGCVACVGFGVCGGLHGEVHVRWWCCCSPIR